MIRNVARERIRTIITKSAFILLRWLCRRYLWNVCVFAVSFYIIFTLAWYNKKEKRNQDMKPPQLYLENQRLVQVNREPLGNHFCIVNSTASKSIHYFVQYRETDYEKDHSIPQIVCSAIKWTFQYHIFQFINQILLFSIICSAIKQY